MLQSNKSVILNNITMIYSVFLKRYNQQLYYIRRVGGVGVGWAQAILGGLKDESYFFKSL